MRWQWLGKLPSCNSLLDTNIRRKELPSWRNVFGAGYMGQRARNHLIEIGRQCITIATQITAYTDCYDSANICINGESRIHHQDMVCGLIICVFKYRLSLAALRFVRTVEGSNPCSVKPITYKIDTCCYLVWRSALLVSWVW